jgi:hypothetical protein
MTIADETAPVAERVLHRDFYPNAATWLNGVDGGHWWARLLDAERDPMRDAASGRRLRARRRD